jgi:hypothetical protein
VNTVLGLIGIVAFIAGVIGLAAGVTWVVVKLSPAPGRKKKTPEPAPES